MCSGQCICSCIGYSYSPQCVLTFCGDEFEVMEMCLQFVLKESPFLQQCGTLSKFRIMRVYAHTPLILLPSFQLLFKLLSFLDNCILSVRDSHAIDTDIHVVIIWRINYVKLSVTSCNVLTIVMASFLFI